MKKNTIIYLVVFVVLLAVAGYLISDYQQKGTLTNTVDYDFGIEDTASIDKIIIKNKVPSEVTLSRKGNIWVVNDGKKARRDAIKTLLMTLKRMEMRNFLPENLQSTVFKRMASYGKEVQIYQNGQLSKTFYVGTETQDEMGTYMLIKGSDQPFAVHIPGFNGYLSSRFFTQEHLWQSREIFSIAPRDIRKLEMVYSDSTDASFSITRFSPDSVFVTDITTGKVLKNANKVNVNMFLSSFKTLSYEAAIVNTDKIYLKRDSLLLNEPVFKLSLTDIDGKKEMVMGYRMRGSGESFDPVLEAPALDPDRMHGFLNPDEMVLLQFYGMRNVLHGIDYFKGS